MLDLPALHGILNAQDRRKRDGENQNRHSNLLVLIVMWCWLWTGSPFRLVLTVLWGFYPEERIERRIEGVDLQAFQKLK